MVMSIVFGVLGVGLIIFGIKFRHKNSSYRHTYKKRGGENRLVFKERRTHL